MRCPLCNNKSLAAGELAEGLPAQRCPNCQGSWIRGERYYQWIERKDRAAPLHGDGSERPNPGTDSTKAKLCPECGRFLTRYAVGHGTSFTIDCCGNCAGIWLDSHEFETLASLGLADKIHFVFSAAWQAELLRQKQETAHDALLQDKLGPGDLAEIKRVRVWIDAHPHRTELLAFLTRGGA